MKILKNFLEKKVRRMSQQPEKKTERAAGVGRRTKEEKVKWNQMTAPKFQTGGRHQTSPASLQSLQQKRQANAGKYEAQQEYK